MCDKICVYWYNFHLALTDCNVIIAYYFIFNIEYLP